MDFSFGGSVAGGDVGSGVGVDSGVGVAGVDGTDVGGDCVGDVALLFSALWVTCACEEVCSCEAVALVVGAAAVCSDSAGGVTVDSVVTVGSSLGVGDSSVSPAEKEDEGADDSSLPGSSFLCKQPTSETVKTAIIKKMLAFLILNHPFIASF